MNKLLIFLTFLTITACGGDETSLIAIDGSALNAGEDAFKSYGDPDFVQKPNGGNGGDITFESSDPSIAEVTASGVISIIAVGSAQITITEKGSNRFLEQSDSFNIIVNSETVDAWQDLQAKIDNGKNGTTINLDGNRIYVLNSTLDLRNFSNITINGNGATIKREDGDMVSTELVEDYRGGNKIVVDFVPVNYRVGSTITIASGKSINQVSKAERQIVSIDENIITVNGTFSGEFKSGSIVFKSYYLIMGLSSSVVNGSNPGTVIENIKFNGNAKYNNINYGWISNGTIALHGGKTSEIRNNYFYDIPNETVVGHGVDVHHNVFDGLNGSAFHTSVHDNTKEINALARFADNEVYNPNRIEKGLNGHSEGAVTFSWGAGNLTVENNYFESISGNYGVLGTFSGALEHTDENLIVRNNTAYNFEYIIRIYSSPISPTKNILITQNVFSDTGVNDFSHLSNNDSIRLGCNTLLDGTTMTIGPENSKCL